MKSPGNKIYARVNVPWSEPWCVSTDFKAYTNPYRILFYNGGEFRSMESQSPYIAGQIVELTLDYYTLQDITGYQTVFTKPIIKSY